MASGYLDFHSFFCDFLLPTLSASSLRSDPGGVVAATEQPFMAAQALTPCDAQGRFHPLVPEQGKALHLW